MGFLARERRVLGLHELLDMLDRGDSPPAGSVLVSFDDGYRNTLDTAAPILARHGLPAIVYLATGYVGRGEAQFIDTLYSAFSHRTRHALDLSREGLPAVMLRDPAIVRRAYVALEQRLATASVEDRTRVLAEVWGQLRPAVEPPRLTLTWDDVARLRRSYGAIALGVHTQGHADLTACAPDVAVREIQASIEDLRREIGETAADFSFPFGRSNETAEAAARAAGVRSAVVTEPAALVRPGANRLALPRLSAPTGMSSFPFLTSGGYPLRSLERR
jgi:peptidoglycan/xylan/chitin deacetylase (PgdA/CDA1 family)